MNKPTAIIEIIILEHKRLDRRVKELAFENCQHEGKCFERCARDKMCINEAVIGWHWKLLAMCN